MEGSIQDVERKQTCESEFYIWQNSFRNKGETKTFQRKLKLRELIITRPVLQEMLKEFFKWKDTN